MIRLYLQVWYLLGRLTGMAGGAAQFCRREAFLALGGYDESIYMGEDVDFYWRLSRTARRAHRKVCYITDVRVVPSSRRRWDRWSVWRTLLWTNPALIALFRRRRGAWRGWYGDEPVVPFGSFPSFLSDRNFSSPAWTEVSPAPLFTDSVRFDMGQTRT